MAVALTPGRSSIYEVFPARGNFVHVALWFVLSSAFVFVQDIALRYSGDAGYLGARVVFGYLFLFVLPAGSVILARNFRKRAEGVAELFDQSIGIHGDASGWAERETRSVFMFSRSLSIWITCLVGGIAIACCTLIAIKGYGFGNPMANAIAWVGALFGIFSGAQGSYTFVAQLLFVRRLSAIELRSGFLIDEKSAISGIISFYSLSTFFVLLLYAMQGSAIWLTSYYSERPSVFWLAFSSLWPLSMLLCSNFYLRKILVQIKKHNQRYALDNIFPRLREVWSSNIGAEEVRDLSAHLNLKLAIDRMQEWPFQAGSIFALLAACLNVAFNAYRVFAG